MGINSIGAYKLSAIVVDFISKLFFMSLQWQFIVMFDDIHFSSVF